MKLNIKGEAAFFLSIIVTILVSCKKNEPTLRVANGTRSELTKDSLFLYAKEIYFWNNQLPGIEHFNPRKYTTKATELGNLEAELFAITRYARSSGTFYYEGNNEDEGPKYSYIYDKSSQGAVAFIPGKRSSVDLEGVGDDFGLHVGAYGSETSYHIIVKAVYPGSDAEQKGVSRGDTISTVNNLNIGSDYNSEIDFLYNALFESGSVTLKGKKAITGAAFTTALSKKTYTSSPVLKDAVFTANAKKIGYMAYARFSHLVRNSRAELERVFNSFSSAGVTDLVVDLRYNGGGYVETAEYILNNIAPASLNGKVMFREHFNQLMQSGKATILKNQPLLDDDGKQRYQNGRLITYFDVNYNAANQAVNFEPTGKLGSIRKVVFLVSESTASSSELLINCLRPYSELDVKVVGTKTYGKPIGFFPVRIDKYEVYLSMFQSKNAVGEGEYFDGMQPDFTVSEIQGSPVKTIYDLGDKRERMLAAAFSYITTGSWPATIAANRATTSKVLRTRSGDLFGDREFKGMIENRIKL